MVLLIQCEDSVGLVASITGILASHQINVNNLREFVDEDSNRFYARFDCESTPKTTEIKAELLAKLPTGAHIEMVTEPAKKVIILVTKEYHCLSDILVRNHFQTLDAEVQCVIGNHLDLKDICDRFSIPFFYISHEDKTKQEFENELVNKINEFEFDYLILAKFMRILSPWFNAQFPLKIINIHHSFLPAFIGANPYRKAFERGVKLIGATAHFVTDNLDEGPIIYQQTTPVNHTFNTRDMVKDGKDIETAVLSYALRMVFQDRVFVHNNKTVVFET